MASPSSQRHLPPSFQRPPGGAASPGPRALSAGGGAAAGASVPSPVRSYGGGRGRDGSREGDRGRERDGGKEAERGKGRDGSRDKDSSRERAAQADQNRKRARWVSGRLVRRALHIRGYVAVCVQVWVLVQGQQLCLAR